MTTLRNGETPHPGRSVMVVLGKAPADLVESLRGAGFEQVAQDGDITVWATLPQQPPSTSAASPDQTAATPGGPPRLLMTIADAALALGLGRSTVYQLIGQGELEVIHVGRSARVPVDALNRLVERLSDAPRRTVA